MAKDENPNAFKHFISPEVVGKIASSISAVTTEFDKKNFLTVIPRLTDLELKARVRLIRDELQKALPQEYPKALKILLNSLKKSDLSGFSLWPYTEFVQTFGLNDLKISLNALDILTERFTAEFAVRPFIKKHPKETLAHLLACTQSSNVHLRRWASEGSRSRLPWGERLDLFIKTPELTLPLLEKLKYDEELYVRKSVANHLNDIAKDNPEVVLTVLNKWQKEAPLAQQKNITWIIHRALRTLIKDGNPAALKLIGAGGKTQVQVSTLKVNKKSFKLNERLEVEFQIRSLAKKPQKLVVDYIIHFVKANKATAPKVFKLKTLTLAAGETLAIRKSHHLKKITTRTFYPGNHSIEIQVNGKALGKVQWSLKL